MERLKQKVASSSSRVIASLQQAASGTFPSSSSSLSSSNPSQQQQQPAAAGATPLISGQQQSVIGGANVAATTSSAAPATQPAAPIASQPAGSQPPPAGQVAPAAVPEAALSTAWLAAADATAHLTEREREILLEVFKKEEQFQRDTIKQMSALRERQQQCPDEFATPTRGQLGGRAPHRVHQQQQQAGHSASKSSCSSAAAVAVNNNKENWMTQQSADQSRTGSAASQTHQQQGQPAYSSPSGRSFCSSSASTATATATTATPANQSRPSSSSATTATTTPTRTYANHPAGSQSRCGSSKTPQTPGAGETNVGQCRICRKLIGSNEPCHLCSNCQQFICDDCASYSAADQHWMCSSCRRRTMNPAIPAEAMKELGLNQNSSAVRRMTLRLNQNDIKSVLNKSSSESNNSSNSSSGCSSSMSTSQRQQQQLKLRQQQQQQPVLRPSAGGVPIASQKTQVAQATPAPPGDARQPTTRTSTANLEQQQQQMRITSSLPAEGSATARTKAFQSHSAAAASATDQMAKSVPSQPTNMPAHQQQQAQQQTEHHRHSSSVRATEGRSYCELHAKKLIAQKTLSQPNVQSSPVAGPTSTKTKNHSLNDSPTQRGSQQFDQSRTTEIDEQMRLLANRRQSARPMNINEQQQAAKIISAQPTTQTMATPVNIVQQMHELRRASVAVGGDAKHHQQPPIDRRQATGSSPARRKQSSAAALQSTAGLQQQFRQTVRDDPLTSRYVFDASRRDSTAAMHQHLLQQQQHLQQLQLQALQQQQQQHQPQPPLESHVWQQQADEQANRSSRRESKQLQFGQGGATLIPIPPEQMHLRRLSDQSNLVRRSSIIVDSLADGLAIARNRSHSNIDSVAFNLPHFGGQLHQQPGEMLNLPANYSNEARRMSDQYVQQAQQPFSSIITSCAQKATHHRNRNSSEEIQSDSSSDIDDNEAARNCFVQQFEQYDDEPQPHQQPNIPIPSVSVSEFNVANQRRYSMAQHQQQATEQILMQQQQRRQQQQQAYQDQVTPMQINVAIEQVIQQQQQQEQLLPGAYSLQPRRGSSGRVLPKIPGEQSRSLLHLPQNGGSVNTLATGNSGTGSGRASGGDGQMLDLPSPTIRRASAPEGQNIKIVVDDIDGSRGGDGAFGRGGAASHHFSSVVNRLITSGGLGNVRAKLGRGEFLERIVLYRDDSLDPFGSNNVGRGFGLQVMGGKLDAAGKLEACVSWVLPSGPADKVGLKVGDRIIEWDGKCLLDMSYEQVAEVIESSANIAELLVKPQPRPESSLQANCHLVRSQRRMSQQTERDLRRFQQQDPQPLHIQQQQFAKTDTQPLGLGAFPTIQRRLSGGNYEQLDMDMQRAGTGRRLPQIPNAKLSANNLPLMSEASNIPTSAHLLSSSSGGIGIRHHASTGQLELQHQHSIGQQLSLGGSQQNEFGGGLIMGGLNQQSQQQQQQQQQYLATQYNHEHQSRSATELNSGNMMLKGNYATKTSSSSPYQQPSMRQQHQGRSRAGSTIVLSNNNNNNWAAQAPASQQQQLLFAGNQQNGFHAQHGHQYQAVNPSQAYYSAANNVGGGGGRLLVANSHHHQDEICGLVGLQVNVDEQAAQLEICVLSAINIDRNPSFEYYARVRILPESNRFEVCTTQPSADMNWKESFIFQNFPTNQVHRMALEIGIWLHDDAPRLSAQMAQPICETLIPIQSARERNTDFWPLRPPPSSPQTRRKSLNDLIESNYNQEARPANECSRFASTGYQQQQSAIPNQWPSLAVMPVAAAHHSGSSTRLQMNINEQTPTGNMQRRRTSPTDSPQRHSMTTTTAAAFAATGQYPRERSASNRNLPDSSNKLQVQPRRASDEVAASSSNRIMKRISPAASRRSISVMNVGDGGAAGFNRSTLGSQSNILKAAQLRRDSIQQQQQQQQQMSQRQHTTGSGSPPSKYGTPTNSGLASRCGAGSVADSAHSGAGSTSSQVVGVTPSGRRSSLAGIQSMSGYKSQKNSQSDATDHESPIRNSLSQKRLRGSISSQQQPQLQQQPQHQHHAHQAKPQAQQPSSGPTSKHPSCSSNSGSRRGSTDQAPQLQRRGSFAMQTLRKLKRTMSLTRGPDSQSGSNQDSRRSSSSSTNSASELGEDLAVARQVKSDSVGRLKLSFIMTKGQFEVEVICAQGLKFDNGSAIGLYVKMYLKAKSKSNKRKTRIVQAWDSPIFKQTIKYDGSVIDNKLLEVSVWLKQAGLRAKIPIGLTEIRLSELNLSQLQTSWYNLRSMDTLASSSIED